MDIIIRKVLSEEAYKYTSLHIACWQDAYKGIIPEYYLTHMIEETEDRTERMRKSLVNPGESKFYCVEIDNEMIGRLIICKSRDIDKPDAGEVAAIYLLKKYWNKGYGQRIMSFALEELKNDGYTEVILWVLAENRRAIRFYEKCGFALESNTNKIFDAGIPLEEVRYTLHF